jgi:hypothetical protein
MGIITDELEIATDEEHEKFLDTTITMTYREFDLSLERARQSGLKTGMEVGRLNAEHNAIIEKSKAVRAACDSFQKHAA